MKKLCILTILVLGFMLLGIKSYAVTTYGDYSLSNDAVGFDFNYDSVLDRLYITSEYNEGFNTKFDFNSASEIYDILDRFSYTLSEMSLGLTTMTFETNLYVDTSFHDYEYNTLVIKVKNEAEETLTRYITLPDLDNLYVKFDYSVMIENDGSNYVAEVITGDFYLVYFGFNDVVLDVTNVPYWNEAEIYLTTIDSPTENNFVNNIWVGYSSASLGTGLQFTQNYFAKYVNLYLAPYAQSEEDLEDMIIDYVDDVRANGITVTMPTNYNVALMIPAYWQAGIDYWYDLNKSVDEVIITIPDLTIDMDINSTGQFGYEFVGEIWGETLIYTVDDIPYQYTLTDDFNNVIPPVFGIYLDTDYYVITFNSTGGTEVSTQFIGIFGTILTPTPPTQAGYQFLGWKRCPYTEAGCSGIDTVWNYDEYIQVTQEILAQRLYTNLETIVINRDTTFLAIWTPIWRSITLILNGGIRKPLENFDSNMLIVEDGNLITENYNEVAFSNNMLERLGYTFEGWYIDSEFTSEFNPATPITQNVTLYANWELQVASEETPDLLTSLIGSMGLADFFGYFLLYVVILVVLIIVLAKFNAPLVIYFIGVTGLSGLWVFLGFFTFATTMIIVLLLISMYVGFYKLRGGSDE